MKRFTTTMTMKLTMRAAIALVVASVGATWCLATTPVLDISSAGPLTHVWIGNDLGCQERHAADAMVHEFYPRDKIPGDYGTFLAMDGVLYAPDFINHGITATAS